MKNGRLDPTDDSDSGSLRGTRRMPHHHANHLTWSNRLFDRDRAYCTFLPVATSKRCTSARAEDADRHTAQCGKAAEVCRRGGQVGINWERLDID